MHFSSGGQEAAKYGVHEIVLEGDGGGANPFDTVVQVTFTPPSGAANAKTVHAFHDGGATWRARTYVSEVGEWRWTTVSPVDARLAGKSGRFTAKPSNLRGRLLIHPKNPRQWMTENGRWFLNLNDTAYFLLCRNQAFASPVQEDDVRAYVRDVVERGITSVRSFTLVGGGGFLEDGPDFRRRWRDAVFADDALTRLHLEHFQVADRRLAWLLEEHPDLYVQFILFSRGCRYGKDDEVWRGFTPEQKERVMRYMIARYAAYPQIFWLVTNDAHYGPAFPHNNAYAREVGEYFRRHDPWQHPMSTGHARRLEYAFGDEAWSTYIHLEENFDVGAAAYAKHARYGKPVFLGEDRYEQDHPNDRDPVDMRYFQRRLFWVWLLSGGSTNYGGRWWEVVPYSETGRRPSRKGRLQGGETARPAAVQVFDRALTGLDSVKPIRDYFAARSIELSDFEPQPGRVKDVHGASGARAPKLMVRGNAEFLIYHPNATADDRRGTSDASRRVEVQLDLSTTSGDFSVEWHRAQDGVAEKGDAIAGGRVHTLRAPWTGHDCVIRVLKR